MREAMRSIRPVRFNGDVEAVPGTDLSVLKAAKRQLIRERLKTITCEQRARDSVAVCQRLAQQPCWRAARKVLAYAPRPDELDLSALIDAAVTEGKIMALPQFDAEAGVYRACKLTTKLAEAPIGTFGIREPGLRCGVVALETVDLILVPGLGFNLEGRRLGRGRGFYDKLLEGVSGAKWGVAFDEQVEPEIPVESHDVLLDAILTPTRWVPCHPARPGDVFVG